MGAMRLSTQPDREDARALATVHAALDAGVTLIDTADAYAHDASESGHNERLIARALATWSGDRSCVRVATKGGLTRPGGRWVPDGRARHLAAACEASRKALGVERISLYQLHAPDPRTALATSVRALNTLRRDGLVEQIGLCNVTLGELREALDIAPIAAVQVELSPWHDVSLRGGVVEHCAEAGIPLLAHRPLGGADNRRRLASDPVLAAVAGRHGASPADVVFAWLRSLSGVIVPLPGPTRPETAATLARTVSLSSEDLEELDAHFPAARLMRMPRARRRPPDDATGDVVLVMGTAGAGKSTLAASLVAEGYERLNRDESGGGLGGLLPALEAHLATGRRRVVLDNTYLSRASRNAVVEAAWAHGAPARCVWLQTSLEEAQVNIVQRMIAGHGRLLGPEEMRRASRDDPGVITPGVLFRHRRELETPEAAEGFTRVDAVPFVREPRAGFEGRAIVFWYDGVVRTSRRGARSPRSPDDVAIVPGARDWLARHRDEGWRLCGLSWHPEVAGETMRADEVEAVFARTHELLGLEIEPLWCPHGEGAPVCWCRKPLPGLGVVLIERHRLDPARCLYVGRDAADRAFARALGLPYREAAEVFPSTANPLR
jgi:aryl-alcohol dehydrogenase-like predicted oxidoreductase/histidinol phosphatase-like enzyme